MWKFIFEILGLFLKKKEEPRQDYSFLFEATTFEKEAVGNFIIYYGDQINMTIPAVSGRHGRGYLPEGEYIAKDYKERTKESMSLHHIGFSVYLEPQFETSRSALMIHFDGNVPGTLGCIGLKAEDQGVAADIRHRIVQIFEAQEKVKLNVQYTV